MLANADKAKVGVELRPAFRAFQHRLGDAAPLKRHVADKQDIFEVSTSGRSSLGSGWFCVGEWRVDPSTCRLRRGEETVKLEPRVMQVLEHLARHFREVVSRADLETEVWRGRTVGYEAVSRTIAQLRKALGDDTRQPKYIETLSKKGYRLIAPVRRPNGLPASEWPEDVAKPRVTRRRNWVARTIVGAAVLLVAMLVVGGLLWYVAPQQAPADLQQLAKPLSVVVIPFNNLSADPGQSFIADGITDSLITELTKISGLFVIARHTAFQYRAEPWTAADLARDLEVRYVLHGSVQRHGFSLRVNARLTDAATEGEMWAESYDGSMHDIFALQDRIARSVVSTLPVSLTAEEDHVLSSRDTESFEAYEHFLRGRQRYYRFAREDNLAARSFYLKAIELDPTYARAHAMLALTYRQEFVNGWSDHHQKTLDAAMQLAEQAIALDAEIPEAYFVKGLVHRERKEFLDAILAAEKAIEIDPSYADGHIVAGSVLYLAGRAEEGLALVEKAMRLNPHYPHNYQLCQGQALYVLGSYEDAADAFKAGIERYPQSERLHLWLAATYAQLGEAQHAKNEIDAVYALNPQFSPTFLEQAAAFRYKTDLDKFLAGVRQAIRFRSVDRPGVEQ
jgi:TolB-like protein/DNA-binding winged helix-turn-helix (wHTH) protein/tetratricopeptide (TPR) repeat protein